MLYSVSISLSASFRRRISLELSACGNILAISIVAFKAVFGNFEGWTESLAGFLTFAVIGFVVLFVVRMIVDFVMFPRVKVADELAIDRNLGVAFIEGAVVISVSLILFFAV